MENKKMIETSVGAFEAERTEFYPNGSIKAAEPVEAVFIRHETGIYIAFDNTPLSSERERLALEFKEDGTVSSLLTVGTELIAIPKDRTQRADVLRFGADWREDPRGTGAHVLIPIRVTFEPEALLVTDSDGNAHQINLSAYNIETDFLPDNIVLASGCGDCSSCNGCGGSCGI